MQNRWTTNGSSLSAGPFHQAQQMESFPTLQLSSSFTQRRMVARGQPLALAFLVKCSYRQHRQFTFLPLKSHSGGPSLQWHITDNYRCQALRAGVECIPSLHKGKAVKYDFIPVTGSAISAKRNVWWLKLARVIWNVLRGLKGGLETCMTHAHGYYMDATIEWTVEKRKDVSRPSQGVLNHEI